MYGIAHIDVHGVYETSIDVFLDGGWKFDIRKPAHGMADKCGWKCVEDFFEQGHGFSFLMFGGKI